MLTVEKTKNNIVVCILYIFNIIWESYGNVTTTDFHAVRLFVVRNKTSDWSFERKTYTWSSRKSSYFEIWRISCEIHPKPYKIRCFNKNSSVWGVQGGGYDPGFHEILVHSPSTAFIKLNSFGWNICFYKVLGGFHMKSTRFHVKSTGFHEIERPLARNCNPMFKTLLFENFLHFAMCNKL